MEMETRGSLCCLCFHVSVIIVVFKDRHQCLVQITSDLLFTLHFVKGFHVDTLSNSETSVYNSSSPRRQSSCGGTDLKIKFYLKYSEHVSFIDKCKVIVRLE